MATKTTKRKGSKVVKKKTKKLTMAQKIRQKAKEQLKKRVKEDSKRSAGFGGANYLSREVKYKKFDPKPGEDYLIDIVPFVMGDKCPINLDNGQPAVPNGEIGYNVDFWIHKGIGVSKNQSVVCPEKTYGRACPICDHKKQLIADGRDIDEEKWEELKSKRRNLYNVVCYEPDQQDEGIQVWDITFHWMQKHLMKLIKGPIRGKKKGVEPFISFSDPSEDGKSIAFSIEKPKSKEAYADYIGHRFENRDYDLDDELLENAIALDQLLLELTYKEIYELYFDEQYDESSVRKGKKRRGRKIVEPEDEDDDSDDDDDDSDDDDVPWEDDDGDEEDDDSDDDGDEEDDDSDDDGDEEEDDSDDDGDEEEDDIDDCPYGYDFGVDFDKADECEDCEVRVECKGKRAELRILAKKKKKPTVKKSGTKKRRKR